jgi:hypothetical protein
MAILNQFAPHTDQASPIEYIAAGPTQKWPVSSGNIYKQTVMLVPDGLRARAKVLNKDAKWNRGADVADHELLAAFQQTNSGSLPPRLSAGGHQNGSPRPRADGNGRLDNNHRRGWHRLIRCTQQAPGISRHPRMRSLLRQPMAFQLHQKPTDFTSDHQPRRPFA